VLQLKVSRWTSISIVHWRLKRFMQGPALSKTRWRRCFRVFDLCHTVSGLSNGPSSKGRVCAKTRPTQRRARPKRTTPAKVFLFYRKNAPQLLFRTAMTGCFRLHALLDLAAAYGSKGLWVQSLQHATRVDGILASRPELRQRSSRDDDESAEVGSADEQTQKMAESVLFVLGKLASLSNSVRWIDLIAVLNAQEAHLLGAAPFGVREGGGAEEMTWAECVSFLRKSHAGFVRATAQLERKCGPHNLALLHLAFQAHDDSGGGVCSPPVLRWSLSKLPACACAFEGSALAKWLGRRCLEWQNESVPITWEETVAIAATAPPSSTKLRARARLVSGQAHAQLPTSRNEAKKYLQQALSLKGGNALSAQAHASLADAYVSEHAAFAKSTAKKCRKEAERWLDSDEGHRLWRAEVSRLMADVRAHVSVSLTKPEVEVRARDVLLDARAEYVERRASKEVDGFLPLEAARTHLEQALQATILAHGAHKQNAFAANAMASLGQLDVVCGRLDAAHANVLRACQLLNAQDGRGTAAAVQLSRIVRRMPNCTAGDLETGASFVKKAAVYHTTAAKSCNKKLKGGLASQAASSKVAADAAAHACQARELWESVALLLPDTQQAVDALQHALEAAKLADGDGIEAMKALRSLAKQRAAMGDHRGAERDYAVLEASALRAGAGDLARKAQKARLNERRHVQDQHF